MIGAVAVLVAAGLLAACSGPASPSAGEPRSSEKSSTTPAGKTPSQQPGAPRTGKPADDRIREARSDTQPTGGFTIRHLEDGKIKQIDVPDFKH